MDDLVLEWRKELGWQKSPFEQKIQTPVEAYLAGYEKEQQKLNLFVLNEKKFGTIQGVAGTGKSMLLLWLKDTLEKHKNKFAVVYLDHDDFKDEKRIVERLSTPFATDAAMKLFFKKLMGRPALTRKNIDEFIKENLGHRRLYILVDSAQFLGKEEGDLFLRLLKIEAVKVILAGPKKELTKDLPKDDLAIELKKLDFDGAKELLKRRIESAGGAGIWPFSDKVAKDLFGLGDYIPGKILQLCGEKAKELAIEVRTGKIPRPEKKGIFIQHEVKVNDKKVREPPVEKKHTGGGFGIKFVVVDEEKPKSVKEALEKPGEPKEEMIRPEEGEGKKETAKGEKEAKADDDFPVININLGYADERKKPEKKPEKKVFEIEVTPKKGKK